MAVKEKPSFFQTTAGVVTGLAGVLTGVVGLLTVGTQLGWFGSDGNGDTAETTDTTVAVGAPAPAGGRTGTTARSGSGGTAAAAIPDFSVDPRSLTFDNLGPREQEVTIRNTGTAGITFQRPQIDGVDEAQFTVSEQTCSSRLDAGRSCELKVTFAPSRAGTFNAILVVQAEGAPAEEIPVKGTRLL
jgi:hypothetical protein